MHSIQQVLLLLLCSFLLLSRGLWLLLAVLPAILPSTLPPTLLPTFLPSFVPNPPPVLLPSLPPTLPVLRLAVFPCYYSMLLILCISQKSKVFCTHCHTSRLERHPIIFFVDCSLTSPTYDCCSYHVTHLLMNSSMFQLKSKRWQPVVSSKVLTQVQLALS